MAGRARETPWTRTGLHRPAPRFPRPGHGELCAVRPGGDRPANGWADQGEPRL